VGAWDRLLRWDERHRFAVDAATAVFALVVLLPLSRFITGSVAGVDVHGGTPFLLTVWLVAPLAWRRVAPVASTVAVYLAGLAQLFVSGFVMSLADVAVLVALYSVTVHGPRWAHRLAIVGALAGSALLGLRVGGWYNSAEVAIVAMVAGVAALGTWAFGLARRARRETIEALVDRADRLELERDQQTQLATAAERARIAREMHDIVAHSLSVVVAQADGGRYAAGADPQAATRALGTIAETGRAALADMRRLLGVLRADPDPASGDAGDAADRLGVRTPQPAEGDVAALVEQVRSSGMRVSLVRTGEPRHLPPGTGLTVYRLAQEALTNVLKHAGPDPRVTVLLSWQPDAIVLQVDDDGRGASASADGDGLGQGMLGMRERAAMFGGSLSAGPRPGGGFRVLARIPTTGATTTKDDA
jgi:signal transduction histidine kinase